jgi:hypothetical protein
VHFCCFLLHTDTFDKIFTSIHLKSNTYKSFVFANEKWNVFAAGVLKLIKIITTNNKWLISYRLACFCGNSRFYRPYWLSEVFWNKPDIATVGRSISLIARLADWGLPLQKVAAARRGDSCSLMDTWIYSARMRWQQNSSSEADSCSYSYTHPLLSGKHKY